LTSPFVYLLGAFGGGGKDFFSSSGASTNDRGQGSVVFSGGEWVLTFTAVGFLLLLRVLATLTDTPPFLVVFGLKRCSRTPMSST